MYQFTSRKMPTIARPLLLVALAFAALFAGNTGAGAAAAHPSLRFVSATGHRLAVHGQGWHAKARLLVVLNYGAGVEGLQVRATKGGGFTVSADNVELCGGLTFAVRDFAGHHRTIKTAALKCASRANPPQPLLKVLSGNAVKSPQVRLLAPSSPGNVTLHVGDSLYLWEPGTTTPSSVAKTVEGPLALLRQGTTAARMCAEVDCAAGFFWEWVATTPGDTTIDLSPGCRQVPPYCGRPDWLLSVHIEP